MAELLLELFSEEIPARMQDRAREDLARCVGDCAGRLPSSPSTGRFAPSRPRGD